MPNTDEKPVYLLSHEVAALHEEFRMRLAAEASRAEMLERALRLSKDTADLWFERAQQLEKACAGFQRSAELANVEADNLGKLLRELLVHEEKGYGTWTKGMLTRVREACKLPG